MNTEVDSKDSIGHRRSHMWILASSAAFLALLSLVLFAPLRTTEPIAWGTIAIISTFVALSIYMMGHEYLRRGHHDGRLQAAPRTYTIALLGAVIVFSLAALFAMIRYG